MTADGDAADGVFGYIDTSVVGVTNEFNQIVFCNFPAAAAAGTALRTAGSQNMAFQISEAASAAGSPYSIKLLSKVEMGISFRSAISFSRK